MCFVRIGVLLVSLAGVLGAQATVVNRKLSGPMVTDLVGDVAGPVISPSGDRVLYRVTRGVDVAGDEVASAHLEVAPTDGSAAPLALTTRGELDVVSVKWTPDGTRAVFLARRSDNALELYSVPVDGSEAPTLLVSPGATESIETSGATPDPGQLTGDSSRVVFTLSTAGVVEVYSVPVTGGTRVRLNGALVSGGEVSLFFLVVGGTVVYHADQDVDGVFDLYAVPADGSAAPVNLSEGGSAAESVTYPFQIAPSGTHAVYLAHPPYPPRKLFAVPLDGSGTAVLLSTSGLPTNRGILDFQVSPDGTSVVYRADEIENDRYELFVAPTDGSAAAAPLVTVASPSSGVEQRYAFSPDGAHLVYQVNPGDGSLDRLLFSVRMSDGRIVPLHATLVSYASSIISADSTRVVFLASFRTQLYSVPIDGSSASVRINPDGGRVYGGLMITPDSQGVVYRADADSLYVEELYHVAVVPTGAPVATKLNPALAWSGNVDSFGILPDSSAVLFLADAETAGITELMRSALAGPPAPTDVSGALTIGAVGDTTALFLARNGRVVYTADQEVDGRFELFGVPSDGSAPAVKISGTLVANGDVQPVPDTVGLLLSPDGATAVYHADAQVDGRFELFSAPTDGSSAPVKLNGPLAAGTEAGEFLISPDGARVVYLASESASPSYRIHSVPIHGGAGVALSESVQLTTAFVITAGSTHVLHGDGGLWSVPIDGSAAPVDLTEGNGSVSRFAATADESRVAFVSASRLYSNAIRGGSRTALSGAFVPGGAVAELEISVDGERAVCRADASTNERYLLFSVPLDGSAAPVALNGPLVGGGDVHSFRLSPDGVNVVYVAEQLEDGTEQLHIVPVDGSAPDTLLSTRDMNFTPYRITPDGAHIVSALPFGEVGLQALPITGGEWVVLSSDVGPFSVTANGKWVVHEESGRLMVTSIEGRPSIALTPTTLGEGFTFTLDGPRVVYRTAQDEATVVELYASWLEFGPTQHPPPSTQHAPPSKTGTVVR